MSYSTICGRVEDLEQEPELARELRKIPVSSWRSDRSTARDFMQKSQTTRCG